MNILIDYQTVKTEYRAGYYLSKALKELGHMVLRQGKDHYIDINFDLYIGFDPIMARKQASRNFYWEVDSTRRQFKEPIGEYDLLFLAGKDFNHYPEGAKWLPMAADPEIHRNMGEPEYDLVNIGLMGGGGGCYGYEERQRLFDIAHDNGFTLYKNNDMYGDDYSREMSKGKLILNRPGLTDLNMRFFESMAIGCMFWYPIGDYCEVATPYIHYVPFRNDEEFLENLNKYTKDETARKQIIKNARELVLAKHTYKHRALEILSYA
jgi:hypothetical protein